MRKINKENEEVKLQYNHLIDDVSRLFDWQERQVHEINKQKT